MPTISAQQLLYEARRINAAKFAVNTVDRSITLNLGDVLAECFPEETTPQSGLREFVNVYGSRITKTTGKLLEKEADNYEKSIPIRGWFDSLFMHILNTAIDEVQDEKELLKLARQLVPCTSVEEIYNAIVGFFSRNTPTGKGLYEIQAALSCCQKLYQEF